SEWGGVAGESRRCLRSNMLAAIIARCDFDVNPARFPTLVFVFDPYIREDGVPINDRQLNLVRRLRLPIAVGPLFRTGVQPGKILTLQLVIQDHALDRATPIEETLLFAPVGAVEVRIVAAFRRLGESPIELLPWCCVQLSETVPVPREREQAAFTA